MKILRALTDVRIDSIMTEAESQDFLGCFPKDKIPTKVSETGMIINLNNDKEPGSHWICFSAIPDQDYITIFDSFGTPPPEQLLKYARKASKKYNKPIIYSSMQAQSTDQESCGWYCIYILTHLEKGYRLDELIKDFSPSSTAINEELLAKFFKYV